MSSAFYISRLPFVPLSEIVKSLNFIDLFNLSQCSKKTAKQIKSVSTRKFELYVDFDRSLRISVYEQEKGCFEFFVESSEELENCQKYSYRNFGFGNEQRSIPVTSAFGYSLVTYWDDTFLGMKMIAFHFMEKLKCQIECLACHHSISVKNFRSFIGEILEKQGKIETLELSLNDLTVNDWKWTFDTVNVPKKLLISLKHNFEYSFKRVPKRMKVYSSSWVTMENLFSFNSCQIIVLQGCELTNQNLDVFMESWKTGGFPNLELFNANGPNLTAQGQIAGILAERNSADGEDKVKKIADTKLTIRAGWDIQRNDGVMASIERGKSYIQMIVWL